MLVLLPYMYVADPTRGRPVFNGKIYIGEPDTDPRIPSNQKEATLVQEDGSSVPAEYPILTNAGGIPTYNGSPVAINVDGAYSLSIDDRNDQQVYYYPVNGADSNFLESDLRSIAFDFGLLYSDINNVLVTSVAGTNLDNARLILDISTGRVLDLPTNIPQSSEVVELNNFILTTNNGQFTLTQAFSNTVENRLKGNQNWNVIGSTGDPLPGVTPTLYEVGDEVVSGVEVITINADQITYVDGILNSGNNTGILRRRYAKDAAGLITKTSQYGGIKLPDGSQLQALVDDISTNGVRITEDGSDIVVDVDLSVITDGFRFFGLSEERGLWTDINDEESLISTFDTKIDGRKYIDVTSARAQDVSYTNNEPYTIHVTVVYSSTTANLQSRVEIKVDGESFVEASSGFSSVSEVVYASATAIVKPGSSYLFTQTRGSKQKVTEYKVP